MKNPFIAMAVMAATFAAALKENALRDYHGKNFRPFDPKIPTPGRGRHHGRQRSKGVPKMFRQYANRYGDGEDTIEQMHKKFRNVPTLDHWRDRREKAWRALDLLQGRKS